MKLSWATQTLTRLIKKYQIHGPEVSNFTTLRVQSSARYNIILVKYDRTYASLLGLFLWMVTLAPRALGSSVNSAFREEIRKF